MERRRVRTENRLRLFDPSGNRLSPTDSARRVRPDETGVDASCRRTNTEDGTRSANRDGTLFLPQRYEPNYRYPLLVWLPDSRSSRFDLGRIMSRVSLRNHVAILPAGLLGGDPAEGPGASADGLRGSHDREAAVWEAVARARREASIAPSRIFLVGQGDGGTEAFRIGCRHADEFAGVVSVGGPFPEGETAFARLASVRRLPMLLCCRQVSETARQLDRTLRLFHAAGGRLAVRLYPSVDSLTAAMLADVNRWVMEQVCGGSESPCPVPT
jgi:phospholipase/carboxylesterase